MKPQEIRRKILEILYQQRAEFMVKTEDLINSFDPRLDDPILHQEIEYLSGKDYLETKAEDIGRRYLYFAGLKITPYGVDLVEDEDAFSRMFQINVAHFGDVSNSNIVANNSQGKQTLNIEQPELTPEIRVILEQLKEAVEKKDVETSNLLLEKLKSGAESVFWNLVASGILSMLK